MQPSVASQDDAPEIALIGALGRSNEAMPALGEVLQASGRFAGLGHVVCPDVLGAHLFERLMLQMLREHPEWAPRLPAAGVDINLFGRRRQRPSDPVLFAVVAQGNLQSSAQARKLRRMISAALAAGARAWDQVHDPIDTVDILEYLATRMFEHSNAGATDARARAVLEIVRALVEAGAPAAGATGRLLDMMLIEMAQLQARPHARSAQGTRQRIAFFEQSLQCILERQAPAQHAQIMVDALQAAMHDEAHATQAMMWLARWQVGHGCEASLRAALESFGREHKAQGQRAGAAASAVLAQHDLRAASARAQASVAQPAAAAHAPQASSVL